jgi:hypothetical protein
MSLLHLSVNDSSEAISEVLETSGAVILDDAGSSEALGELRRELTPYLEAARPGGDEFGGFSTRRVGALMARSAVCRGLALDARVLAACDLYLKPYCDGYQLHFTQAVQIGPGQGAQPLHRDRGVWGKYLNRSIETQFSTIWAVDEFTADNGATRVVPGSHLWEASREPEPGEIFAAVMRPGSVLLYNGSVLHGGGANRGDTSRLGVLLHYCPSWLRQEENQYLSCPPSVARDLAPELRALMGYSKGGYVLGFFSPPVGPGEGPELVSPEMLFGEPVSPAEPARTAAEVIDSSK